AEIAWLIYKKRLELSALLWGLFGFLAMMLVTAGNAWILNRVLMRAGAMPVNWVAHPVALQAAFWFLALAVVSTVAFAFSRHAGFLGLWAGVWSWWALLSIVSTVFTHGIAYLFPLTLCVAVLAAIPLAFGGMHGAEAGLVAGVAPLAVAAIAGFEVALLLYSA